MTTPSDLASRAQARDYVEAIVAMPFRCRPVDDAAVVAADRLLDPENFARLAGLLGYVKADGEEWKHGNESGGGSIHRSLADAVAERDRYVDEIGSPFEPPKPPSTGVAHRYVTSWEKVTDAEQG